LFMIVIKEYSIKEILDRVQFIRNKELRRLRKINLEGYLIKICNLSLQTFKKKGIRCVKCGLVANVFRLMYDDRSRDVFLGLFFVDSQRVIRFTKDHIIPKSQGGKDFLSNLQTMCEPHNLLKDNKIEYRYITESVLENYKHLRL